MELMHLLPAAANRNDAAAVRRILRDGQFNQQHLDLALARAVLRFSERRAIAELLIGHGADPNGQYGADYGPIVFVTGECLEPGGLQFLIDHGADVAFPPLATKYGLATPVGCTLGTYLRGVNERKHRCLDILLRRGARVPPEVSAPMLAIHRGDASLLADWLKRDPPLLGRTFPDMPYGNVALRGATLTHLAVEFGELDCLDVLLDRGADINQPAEVIDGLGGQTPIFHAIATNQAAGIPTLEHLARRAEGRIDMSTRATFRLFGEPQTTPITPLQYAQQASRPQVPESRRTTPRELALLESLQR